MKEDYGWKNRRMKLLILLLTFLLFPFVSVAADVMLEWDSNLDSPVSYNIYRSADHGENWTILDSVLHGGSGTETYTDEDVPDGELEWYVTAVDDGSNESGPSNVVNTYISSTRGLSSGSEFSSGRLGH